MEVFIDISVAVLIYAITKFQPGEGAGIFAAVCGVIIEVEEIWRANLLYTRAISALRIDGAVAVVANFVACAAIQDI